VTARDEPFPRADYYRLLQVDPGAHPEVIRAAYRTLLRVLARHPDLGGGEAEARAIIEAYRTLSNPERRRAYDLWLRVHTRPAGPPRGLPPRIAQWIRSVLAEYRDAPGAPFAPQFDLVLQAPGFLAARLYARAQPLLNPARWPALFAVCRGLRAARPLLLPSADAVLVVTVEAPEAATFLRQAHLHERGWWHRVALGVLTVFPFRVIPADPRGGPEPLRRLVRAAAPPSGEPCPR
jgi:hypothetical protein